MTYSFITDWQSLTLHHTTKNWLLNKDAWRRDLMHRWHPTSFWNSQTSQEWPILPWSCWILWKWKWGKWMSEFNSMDVWVNTVGNMKYTALCHPHSLNTRYMKSNCIRDLNVRLEIWGCGLFSVFNLKSWLLFGITVRLIKLTLSCGSEGFSMKASSQTSSQITSPVVGSCLQFVWINVHSSAGCLNTVANSKNRKPCFLDSLCKKHLHILNAFISVNETLEKKHVFRSERR